LAWNDVVVEELMGKQMAADNMHHHLLVKKCFADWKKVRFLTYLFLVVFHVVYS